MELTVRNLFLLVDVLLFAGANLGRASGDFWRTRAGAVRAIYRRSATRKIHAYVVGNWAKPASG